MAKRNYCPSEAIYDGYVVGTGTPAETQFFALAMDEFNCDVDKVLSKYSLCNPNERQMLENVKLIQSGQTKGFNPKYRPKRFRFEYDILNDQISKMRSNWYQTHSNWSCDTKAQALKVIKKMQSKVLTDYFGEKFPKYFNFKLTDTKTNTEIEIV